VIQGHLLRQSGRFEEAKEAYRQAFSMRVKYDEVRDNANRLCYLAETERLAGQQGLALEHYQEGLAAWRQAHDSKGICEASLGTGKVLLARGAHQEALVFLEECRKLAEENGFHDERKEVYQALSEAYATKDPTKALAYRRLFDEWKERVLGAEVATQVVGILNKYEKTRLDREILHLRRQNRWGFAGLLLLATAFAAGMFYWLRGPKVIPSNPSTADIAPSSQTLPAAEDPDSGRRPKYVRSLLTEEQARPYLNRLKTLMEQDQLYLDPELSVDTLSKKLRLNSKYLSQLVNAHIGKSFNDYLNELRFEKAKKLLTDPARSQRTVLEIGHDAGFNSKSTFYRVFKQAVGMTPVEYRAQQSRKGVA